MHQGCTFCLTREDCSDVTCQLPKNVTWLGERKRCSVFLAQRKKITLFSPSVLLLKLPGLHVLARIFSAHISERVPDGIGHQQWREACKGAAALKQKPNSPASHSFCWNQVFFKKAENKNTYLTKELSWASWGKGKARQKNVILPGSIRSFRGLSKVNPMYLTAASENLQTAINIRLPALFSSYSCNGSRGGEKEKGRLLQHTNVGKALCIHKTTGNL